LTIFSSYLVAHHGSKLIRFELELDCIFRPSCVFL